MRVEPISRVPATNSYRQLVREAPVQHPRIEEPLVLYNNKGLLEVYCWFPKSLNEKA